MASYMGAAVFEGDAMLGGFLPKIKTPKFIKALDPTSKTSVVRRAVTMVNPFEKGSVVRSTLRAVDPSARTSLKTRIKDVGKSVSLVNPFDKSSVIRSVGRYVDPTQTGMGAGRVIGLAATGVLTGGLGVLAAGAVGIGGDIKNRKRKKAAQAEAQQNAIATANPASTMNPMRRMAERIRQQTGTRWKGPGPTGYINAAPSIAPVSVPESAPAPIPAPADVIPQVSYQEQAAQPVVEPPPTTVEAQDVTAPVPAPKKFPILPLIAAAAVAGYFIMENA